MDREKKLVLVFPPLTMPTSPPLGPAMLKSFVERELPAWRVKVVDLNIRAFNLLLDMLSRGLPLPPAHFPEGRLGEIALLRAAEVFRGASPQEFYARPDRYEIYSDLFLRFTELFTQELASVCRTADAEGVVAPILLQLLEAILEKPNCVGISMLFSQQVPVGVTLGRLLRTRHGLKVFLGGSTFADHGAEFLSKNPDAADVIVDGEGEEALKKLLQNMDDPSSVPGVAYFKDGCLSTSLSL